MLCRMYLREPGLVAAAEAAEAAQIQQGRRELDCTAQEPGLVSAAEALWDVFAAHPATAGAAARMLERRAQCPLQAATALGRTAWNAYSFNLDYRTGEYSHACSHMLRSKLTTFSQQCLPFGTRGHHLPKVMIGEQDL